VIADRAEWALLWEGIAESIHFLSRHNRKGINVDN
jgi:hypothetical protein